MADAATTDILYRALRSANADPDLAHAAAAAVRDLAGENVTSVLEAKIDVAVADFGAKLDVAVADLRSEFRSEIAELRGELRSEIGNLRGEIKGIHHAIESANRINRVLVIILGSGVAAILVRVFGIVP